METEVTAYNIRYEMEDGHVQDYFGNDNDDGTSTAYTLTLPSETYRNRG